MCGAQPGGVRTIAPIGKNKEKVRKSLGCVIRNFEKRITLSVGQTHNTLYFSYGCVREGSKMSYKAISKENIWKIKIRVFTLKFKDGSRM